MTRKEKIRQAGYFLATFVAVSIFIAIFVALLGAFAYLYSLYPLSSLIGIMLLLALVISFIICPDATVEP